MDTILQAQFEKAADALANGEPITLGDVKGISPAELEAVYAVGFNYYRTGRIADAEKIFKFLCMFDHLNQKYWTGLGAVLQVEKRIDRAIPCYGYAMMLDLDNPKPQYHLAECYLALGDKEAALATLEMLAKNVKPTSEAGRTYLAKGIQLKAVAEKLSDEPSPAAKALDQKATEMLGAFGVPADPEELKKMHKEAAHA